MMKQRPHTEWWHACGPGVATNMLLSILETYQAQTQFARVQGERFERSLVALLKLNPQYQALFDRAWLCKDWPQCVSINYQRHGIGIDLVAQLLDVSCYCAVQRKFYPQAVLLDEPCKFFTLSGKEGRQLHHQCLQYVGQQTPGPNWSLHEKKDDRDKSIKIKLF